MDALQSIKNTLQESIATKSRSLADETLLQNVATAVELCVHCLVEQGRLLFCGNGGSAADAQHLAAEFSGRYYFDRPPLDAEALHVNTSYLTAVANDYAYDEIFARLVAAKGRKGDVLLGFSTSGNSPNVVRAFERAQALGLHTIAFTGEGGGKLGKLADVLLAVPSHDTPRIQEVHITLGHILCELVEKAMFPTFDK